MTARLDESIHNQVDLVIEVDGDQTLHIAMPNPDQKTRRVLERLVELWNRHGVEPEDVGRAIDEWEGFTAGLCISSIAMQLTIRQYDRTKALIVKALQEARQRGAGR